MGASRDGFEPVALEEIPRISLGTMTFGGQVDEADAGRILDEAIARGVTLIDTANVYQSGLSEEFLGRLLAGRRDRILLASKVGSPTPNTAPPLRPDRMREELLGSLQRLRTDRLDVFYLHRPDRTTPLEESLGALQSFIDEGLVRSAAVSNYAAWHLATMRAITERHGWDPIRISQPMYNLLARRLEDEYGECTSELGIANIVYNPLAGGLLTGKHQLGDPVSDSNRFGQAKYGGMYRDRYWNEDQFSAVHAVQGVAREAGIPVTALALRWCLSRPSVTSVLIGVSSLAQLRENLDACESGPLPQDVLDACDAVRQLNHGAAPDYVK